MFNNRSKSIESKHVPDSEVVFSELGENNTDIKFTVRGEHLAQDMSSAIQLSMLQGYIECAQEYEIEIDQDIYTAFEILLQKLLANSSN